MGKVDPLGIAARYERNGILTAAEQNMLAQRKVAVVGCGGLGGYILEMLGRLGVGHLVVCDGDRFAASNLNRQLLSKETNLGMLKAEAAGRRLAEINSQVEVTVIPAYLDEARGTEILAGCDVAVDALDSGEGKLMLQDLCCDLEIPMVHGAIGGWFGQVTTVFPGDDSLRLIYGEGKNVSDELGNPAFTPAAVAAAEVSEALKVLLGRGELLRRKVLFIDLFYGEFEVVKLEGE